MFMLSFGAAVVVKWPISVLGYPKGYVVGRCWISSVVPGHAQSYARSGGWKADQVSRPLFKLETRLLCGLDTGRLLHADIEAAGIPVLLSRCSQASQTLPPKVGVLLPTLIWVQKSE